MKRLPFRGRADQKLEYAHTHLGELQSYQGRTSNDAWENAHQESCLFHLAGTVDAVLHEINEADSLGCQGQIFTLGVSRLQQCASRSC